MYVLYGVFGVFQLEEYGARERVESFSSLLSKRTAFMSVNEAPSFTSIPEIIEESEIWVRGPISKLPPLSDPVPSDWEVVEGSIVFLFYRLDQHKRRIFIIKPVILFIFAPNAIFNLSIKNNVH